MININIKFPLTIKIYKTLQRQIAESTKYNLFFCS